MKTSFDYDEFLGKSLNIIARSRRKSFAQLAEEIRLLGQEYRHIRDRAARKFMKRDLNRRLLIVALDRSQPQAVVERLYRQCVKSGFNNLHAEIASSIEYAHVCRERGFVAEGQRILRKVAKNLREDKKFPSGPTKNCLKAIEESIRRLEEES